MQYTVSAYVTILPTVTITANSPEEAEEKFAELMEERYGYADFDEINIE